MKISHAILVLIVLASPSCMSTGRLQFSGDLTPLGLPATFHYDSGKNPIRSNK
jgi:hypothetical protein